ncbi:hypothetical protein [Falsibacillus albus]|uniref:Uncharacterized protein n=1 Tax=Falsibacillus albus TaxID=2478915 RepID=A0A3L7K1G9_9BACI|nr:hypothetical protein [Falsibacillus albus]RLQ95811.1 hypothetical protein D9X91_09320 [Falsibacillus albus]
MDNQKQQVYRQLKQAHLDLEAHQTSNVLVRHFIEQEKLDVAYALEKWEKGTFGICEMSGELIPFEMIHFLPTIRTKDEWTSIQAKYGKSRLPISP